MLIGPTPIFAAVNNTFDTGDSLPPISSLEQSIKDAAGGSLHTFISAGVTDSTGTFTAIDISGNGRNMTATGTAPTVVTDGNTGLASLDFTLSGGPMVSTAPASDYRGCHGMDGEYVIYCCVRYSTSNLPGGDIAVWTTLGGTGADRVGTQLTVYNTGLTKYFTLNGPRAGGDMTPQSGLFPGNFNRLLKYTVSSNDAQLRYRASTGNDQTVSATGVADGASINTMNLGAGNAEVSALIVMDNPSTTQVNAVDALLAANYI